MAKKPFRFYFALVCGKLTIELLRLLRKRATNFPGSVVLTLCPDFLKYLEKPEKIIAVTGTNGKTTVSNMLLDILTDNGYDCTNNNFGGNVDTGITAALLKDSTLSGKPRKKYCTLEIDERSAVRIYPYIHPDYLICTNLTRDSYKRNAHVEYIFDILNSNTADVVNGSAARTKAVRTTIHEMAQKGIPAFIDRAGREWSPEAYVNMDIRATVKNTALEAKFSVMDSLGQDVFEVSSHPGSRPKCRPWQGKLISRSGKTTEITDLHGRKHKVIPLSQTSFGEPDGLFGINCGHRPRGCSEGVFTKSTVEYDDEAERASYLNDSRLFADPTMGLTDGYLGFYCVRDSGRSYLTEYPYNITFPPLNHYN